MTIKLADRVSIKGAKIRESDGALVTDARIARTGIQRYLGREVGRPDLAEVRVYRPGSEVFSQDTLKSVAHRPVTNDHPKELVTAETWKDVAVGQTSDQVVGENIFIRVPLMVSDASAIADVQGGKRELSAGYTCDLEFTAGVTDSGEEYDAVQRNIRFNHVAIVAAGRAGSEVRIGDGAAEDWASPQLDNAAPEKDPSMPNRSILVDGIPVEVTDQGATVIETLQKRIADAAALAGTTKTSHDAIVTGLKSEIATKDATIDDLKSKILTDADIDKRVAARADLVTKANLLAKDVKTEGLTDSAIRKAVVVAVLGDALPAARADDQVYLDTRFEILLETIKDGRAPAPVVVDPLRQVLGDIQAPATSQTAYDAMLKRNAEAYLNTPAVAK